VPYVAPNWRPSGAPLAPFRLRKLAPDRVTPAFHRLGVVGPGGVRSEANRRLRFAYDRRFPPCGSLLCAAAKRDSLRRTDLWFTQETRLSRPGGPLDESTRHAPANRDLRRSRPVDWIPFKPQLASACGLQHRRRLSPAAPPAHVPRPRPKMSGEAVAHGWPPSSGTPSSPSFSPPEAPLFLPPLHTRRPATPRLIDGPQRPHLYLRRIHFSGPFSPARADAEFSQAWPAANNP